LAPVQEVVLDTQGPDREGIQVHSMHDYVPVLLPARTGVP
jgi:hypothetical protein